MLKFDQEILGPKGRTVRPQGVVLRKSTRENKETEEDIKSAYCDHEIELRDLDNCNRKKRMITIWCTETSVTVTTSCIK